MNKGRWFLGIDGGGTKTEAALGSSLGDVVWGKAGPSNPRAVSREVAALNVRQAVKQAEKLAGKHRPYRTVIGIAGMDTPKDVAAMRRVLRQTLKNIVEPDFQLVNDIIIALASGTTDRHAAVIISGTGSNAYARGPKGTVRAGGRGHRLADEGSGYAQGLATLHAVTKAADGRGVATQLTKYVLQHFQIRKPEELVHIVYQPSFGKPQIAALAPYVQAAAEKGDVIAKKILADAADELALLATTVIRKSGLHRKIFSLVTVGGIFKCPVVLPSRFKGAVRMVAPKVQFIRPKLRPAIGAWGMAGGGEAVKL
ncbi:MAG: BadF/BadG/BcrA/BcrD ATPase family protein [Patescibacteria group bacterium]|jgi:N-acetylglucosamine kinase-like BadF-type ATPase